MFLDRIVLKDFRIYYGQNEIVFNKEGEKNVFIISGSNGYGKTTLLTALVWTLYGKLMIDVDEKYKSEIYDSGGYKKYALDNLNRLAKSQKQKFYSVQINLSDIYIPSIPCNEVIIKRTFNVESASDDVEILIDGSPNELANEVGYEIFINDFILPKEIAKFFFFDAEKIVSLAEIRTIEDRRKLSKAYSEVLGIKKYEDLKSNLEDLRIRLRRNSVSEKDKDRFIELQNDIQKINKHISIINSQLKNLEEEKTLKKSISENFQERLIREGHSMSLSELIFLKEKKKELEKTNEHIKNKIKELLEYAPFAIALNNLDNVIRQVKKELLLGNGIDNPELMLKKITSIKRKINNKLKGKKISNALVQEVSDILVTELKNSLIPSNTSENNRIKILHNFNENEVNELLTIKTNLEGSFKNQFQQLYKSYKDNKNLILNIGKKVSDAESKERDALIQEIRKEKELTELEVMHIEEKINKLNQDKGAYHNELANKSKVLSELTKLIEVQEKDSKKDEVAQNLINNLKTYLNKLKIEKKKSLEERLLKELKLLMHKNNFVMDVKIEILDDLIEINLFDARNALIKKETLSKGEQQLYATALLKALVDESEIEFPVFIDSPLQKFDKDHSRNIICEFYPNISKQVTIFPLIKKELTKEEFHLLESKVNSCFIIKNIEQDKSVFEELIPSEFIKLFKIKDENVFQY
ncbi:MAG: AAA family ATPase [Ignavibacterium sp.]|nr:AAA family ATPase [Ignavibacterium sp.]